MKIKIDHGNIPQELIELPQWGCYDIEYHLRDGEEKQVKVPYIAGSTEKVRANDPSTFSTFEEALADVESGNRDYLGFFLLRENDLIFMDFDETSDPEERALSKLIMQTFPSYTELSVSGEGAHVIARGSLEGRGLHNSHFGLFNHARGILMTGHILHGQKKIKRANKKALLSLQTKVRTSDSMGYDFELEEHEWDAQPWAINSLCSKIYKDKFHALIDGRWEGLGYPSQSEADHALVNMYCDVTDSNALVRFMFAESGLYRDWKSRKDQDSGEYSVKGYIDYSIKKNRWKAAQRDKERERAAKGIKRAKEKRKKDVAKAKNKVKKVAKEISLRDDSENVVVKKQHFDYPIDMLEKLPSQLHRDLALFLYKNSYCPNQEIASLTSFVIITSIVQRAYLTPTGTGLNLNWWLITETGWGKDIFVKGFDLVVNELMKEHGRLSDSQVGKFASGEAIETVISNQPRFMSKVTEAGAFWRKLLSPQRPPHIDALVESMLNLFMSTNPGSYWKSRRKAKKDEDLSDQIFRPAGSFYGESTPEDLLGDLDHASIATGLLQRQLFYHIDKADYTKSNKTYTPMSSKLKAQLSELITLADNLDVTNDTIDVQISKNAYDLLDEFEEGHRKYAFRKEKNRLRADLMNRSGLKAYRLASILAICDEHEEPRIEAKHAQYAIDFVSRCDGFILDKFQSGDVGRGQLKQESDMLKLIRQASEADSKKRRRSYRMNEYCADDPSIVPYSWLKNKAKSRASFSADKLGPITAIDRCIDSLCRSGTLLRLTRTECEEEYDTSAGLLRYTAND